MNNRTWWITAILFSILFGSTYSIFSKFLLQRTIPETVILWSQIFTVIAAVVFFGLFPEVKHMYAFPNKKIWIMVIVAIFSGILAPLLYMKGLSETLATNAIVTSRLSSIFMGIIWFVRLKEKVTWRRVLWTCVMFFGVYYITTKWFASWFGLDAWVMLVWAAAFFSAMGHTIFKKYLEDIDVELAIFIRNWIGVLFFLLFVPYLFNIDHNLSSWFAWETWMYFLGLALIPVFFSQYLWYSWLQYIPVSQAWSLNLLNPLFGIMLAYIFLSEPLWWYHLIWSICLVGWICITMFDAKKLQDTRVMKSLAMFRFSRK